MNAILFAAVLASDPSGAGEHGACVTAVADLHRFAEPFLRVRADDTPDRLAQRHRLAQLVDYVDRCVLVQFRSRNRTNFYNAVQVLRDLADQGCVVSATPLERLRWQLVVLHTSERLTAWQDRVNAVLGPPPPDPPTSLNQARAQHAQFHARSRGSS